MTNDMMLPDLAPSPDSESVESRTQVMQRTIARLPQAYDTQNAISFGKYKLVGKLGSGGMGVVYLALETFDEDAGVQRDVAIKMIRPDSLNAGTMGLLRQEATMMAQIKSDAVVQVRELGNFRGYYGDSVIDMPYIAMERILGITFRNLIEQLRKKHMCCPAILAAALIRAAADGLFDLHSLRDHDGNFRRAVHRDVTPRNLMISFKGAVKVIDFGVADVGDWNRRCQSVEPYGVNAAYLAPELFDGSGYLSNKADIFSLGLVLHELLTGKSVFASKGVIEQCAALENFSFTPIGPIPRELNDCLGRMLEVNPGKRHATAKAVAAELQEIVTIYEPRFHDAQICAEALMELGVDLNPPHPAPLSNTDRAFLPEKHFPVQPLGQETQIPVVRLQGNMRSVRHTVAKHDIDLSFITLENLRSSPTAGFILANELPPLQIQLTHRTAEICLAGRDAKIYLDKDDPRKSVLNFGVRLGDSGTFFLGHRSKRYWQIDFYSATFMPGTSPRRIFLKDMQCVLSFEDALDVVIVFRVEPIERGTAIFAIGGGSNA